MNNSKKTLPVVYGNVFKQLRKIPYNDQWYRAIKSTSHQSAKLKNIPFNLDSLYVKNLFKEQHRKCAYCKISNDECTLLQGSRLSVDRIIPELGYVKGNVCLACPICNTIKGNDITASQMIRIGRQIRSFLKNNGKVQYGHLGKEHTDTYQVICQK